MKKENNYGRSYRFVVFLANFLFMIASIIGLIYDVTSTTFKAFYAFVTNRGNCRNKFAEIMREIAVEYNYVLAVIAFCVSAFLADAAYLHSKMEIVPMSQTIMAASPFKSLATALSIFVLCGLLTAFTLWLVKYSPVSGYVFAGLTAGVAAIMGVYTFAAVWTYGSWGQRYACLMVYGYSTMFFYVVVDSIRLFVNKQVRINLQLQKEADYQSVRQTFKIVE